MKVIPAIDIIDGKCVRLTQGDYNRKTVYNDNPVEVARRFEDLGFKYLHVVDLDGARSRHIVNANVLREITETTDLIVDFGGGLKTRKDLDQAFEAGAARVTGGSIAVRDPENFTEWIREFGPDKIILGADVKGRNIAVGGWMETSNQDIIQFIQYYIDRSVKYIICTDIARDGALEGPAIDLYRELIKNFPGIHLIASGGVGSMADLEELADTGVWGVIVGKAIYEGRIKLDDLITF